MLIGVIYALSGVVRTVFFNAWTNRQDFEIHNVMCMFIFSQVISWFFLLTDFNILAELLISYPVFQKCDPVHCTKAGIEGLMSELTGGTLKYIMWCVCL